ncbi:MAG: hypothetical protein ABI586_07845, partial [Candidatus Nanopelagicales bacterium]
MASSMTLAGSGIEATPAWAESADQARERAAQAAAEVDALQSQVDQAQAQFENAMNSVAGAISHSVSADRAAAAAAQQAHADEVDRIQAVRALNQSAGPLGIMETVLSADSPSDVVARWQMGQSVMASLAV